MQHRYGSGSTEANYSVYQSLTDYKMSVDPNSKISEIRERLEKTREENRQRANAQLHQPEEEHKSLYDVLKENQQRLDEEYSKRYTDRNSLKRLDEDEVAYLKSLKEEERRKEALVQRELEQGLQEFHK